MKNIWNIVKLSRPLHRIIALQMVLVIISALFELVTPLISKNVVDEIISQIEGTSGKITNIIFYIVLGFILNFFGVIITTVSNRLGDHLAGRLRKYLTEQFYAKILTLPQSYFDTEVSGKILNQLNRGIANIHMFTNSFTNFFFPSIVQSVYTILAMAYFNIYVAVAISLLFPIYFFLTKQSTMRWGKEEVKKNAIEDATRGRIQEVVANIKLVKSFLNEPEEYSFVSQNLSKSNTIYARQSTMFHGIDFIRNASLTIILTIVGILIFISAFRETISIGEMVLLLQLVGLSRRPLFAMSFILTRIQEADSGSKEYFEILALPSTEQFNTTKPVQSIINPEISFHNVSFRYESTKEVLKNISFTLHKGEKVALVGHSGAGKSTIVNLILKFYEPTSGQIRMNNISYQNIDHRSIRHNIALVFQENEVFSSTIRDNVAYGKQATDEEIIVALKKAYAYDFVMQLPGTLDAEIGERGVKLSGGQKQRIQIARAIHKDSPILILDEATSSLDSQSEAEVQHALENLMKDRLVLIIAHRFSTIQNVDRIIVMDNGTIADSGTPRELSSRKGIYKDLLTYQVKGNKKLLEQFELY